MLEVKKEKTQNDVEELVVHTDQGKFIVTKEKNNDIYLGCNGYSKKSSFPIKYVINKENYDVYKIFYDFYSGLRFASEDYERTCIKLYSDDFDEKSESSSLSVSYSKNTEEIILIFQKSHSEKWHDNYFIKVSGAEELQDLNYQVLDKLYNDLNAYSPDHRQIDIEEYLFYLSINKKDKAVRTRVNK